MQKVVTISLTVNQVASPESKIDGHMYEHPKVSALLEEGWKVTHLDSLFVNPAMVYTFVLEKADKPSGEYYAKK